MRAPLSLIPLAPVAACFVAGVLCGLCNVSPWLIGLPFAAAVLLALWRHTAPAVLAAVFALGAVDGSLNDDKEEDSGFLRGRMTVTGDVTACRDKETSRLLTLRLLQAGADSASMKPVRHILARVVVPAFEPDIMEGDRVVLEADFNSRSRIEYFPDMPDHKAFLRRSGICADGIASPDSVLAVEPSPALLMRFARLKGSMRDLLLRTGIDAPTKEFLVTTVTGDTSVLDPDTREMFAGAGIAHVLALSGLHAGILTMLLMALCAPLRFKNSWRRATPIIVMAGLWLYALATGCAPSVLRAVVMASALMLSMLVERRNSPVNALCLAMIVIVAVSPAALFNAGFQMSCAAVAGILAFGRVLNPAAEGGIVSRLLSPVTASIGAMLATGLIAAYYFHKLPLLFLVANVAAAPLIVPLVGGGMITVILEGTGIGSSLLWPVLDALSAAVHFIARSTGGIDWAAPGNIVVSPPAIVLGLAATGLLALWLHRRRSAAAIGSAVCAVGCVAIIVFSPRPEPEGVFVVPGSYRTDIYVSTPQSVNIITTARRHDHEGVLDHSRRALAEYTSRRAIPEVVIADTLNLPLVKHRWPWLNAGSNRGVIASGMPKVIESEAPLDFAIVCRGYTGRIDSLPLRHGAVVILSSDLHPSRAARYAEECAAAGLRFIDLRRGPAPDLLRL